MEEQPAKQPGKSEVRLRVQAVGLSRAELMFLRSQYVEDPKLPAGLGYEAVGVVEAGRPGCGQELDRQTGSDHSSFLDERLRHAGRGGDAKAP